MRFNNITSRGKMKVKEIDHRRTKEKKFQALKNTNVVKLTDHSFLIKQNFYRKGHFHQKKKEKIERDININNDPKKVNLLALYSLYTFATILTKFAHQQSLRVTCTR